MRKIISSYDSTHHTLLLRFSLSFLSFSVFPFRRFVPFSFVLSFRLVVFAFCFLDRVLRFSFRFPAFLGGGFCYSVISSRPYHPPALLASLKYSYSPRVLLPYVVDVAFFFSFLPSLFRCWFGDRLFHPVFFLLLGSPVSVSAETRLAYVWYVSWFVRTLISLFFLAGGIQFVSVIVCMISFSSGIFVFLLR